MDTLSTKGMPKEYVLKAIAETEAKYSSRAEQNEKWRTWLALPANKKALFALCPDIDINAAFISTCRNDIMHCGACRLSRYINQIETKRRTQHENSTREV